MIVMSTNCICDGVNVNPERIYKTGNQVGLITEGLLRLFAGETLAPTAFGADNTMYRFSPIDLAQVSAIVWSPLADQAGGWANQEMADHTPYPYTDSLIMAACGCIRPSITTMSLWWQHLDAVTANVPLRIFVPYPTTFLERTRMGERVLASNVNAERIFRDWHRLTVDRPEAYDSFWAHFTLASRADFLKQLAQLLAASA